MPWFGGVRQRGQCTVGVRITREENANRPSTNTEIISVPCMSMGFKRRTTDSVAGSIQIRIQQQEQRTVVIASWWELELQYERVDVGKWYIETFLQ